MRKTNHNWLIRGYKLIISLVCLCFLSSCSDHLLDEEGKESVSSTDLFEWTRSADKATHLSYLRNYGVGYSYNAVNGDYCNWKDIRCQIINRNVVERLKENNSIILYGQNEILTATQKSKLYYTQRDYVAGIHIDSEQAIDLGLYNNTKRTRQDILEDGLQENFYYSIERTLGMGSQWISDSEILAYVSNGEYPYLFTESFRNAVSHMQEAVYADKPDETRLVAMVDSFIQVYGTHVIVSATLGGKLRLDLSNDMWRFNDQMSEDQWSMEQILHSYEQRKESRRDSTYQYLEKSSIYITAYGGDQTLLTNLLGKTTYEGSRTFSMAPIEKWQSSLKFDLNDEKESNVELINMQVKPIWSFVEALDPDGELTERIREVTCDDISREQAQLNSKLFFNTSFPTHFSNPQVKVRNHTGGYTTLSWEQIKGKVQSTQADNTWEAKHPSLCVNIVSGGKMVATVCHERIEGEAYWVAYPIYDGKMKQTVGIAINDSTQKAYKAVWNGDKCKLTLLLKDEAPQTATFYINEGGISLKKDSELTYTEAHPMLYVESTGGVQPDGSFELGSILLPIKQGTQFILPSINKNAPDVQRLIQWQWNETDKRYERTSSYTYLYNPTEMDYVE